MGNGQQTTDVHVPQPHIHVFISKLKMALVFNIIIIICIIFCCPYSCIMDTKINFINQAIKNSIIQGEPEQAPKANTLYLCIYTHVRMHACMCIQW